MDAETSLCPTCGWTGRQSELDGEEGEYACPICDTDIEIVE
ncbi:hypothetical protein [Halorussus amylolyticus]|nr:hypothetical protein [Halorussus amylolyticus]